jgi:hypothetical protein
MYGMELDTGYRAQAGMFRLPFNSIPGIIEKDVQPGGTLTDRHTLHSLIDQLPEDGLEDARKLLKEYLDSRDDYEDEERTLEEIAAWRKQKQVSRRAE